MSTATTTIFSRRLDWLQGKRELFTKQAHGHRMQVKTGPVFPVILVTCTNEEGTPRNWPVLAEPQATFWERARKELPDGWTLEGQQTEPGFAQVVQAVD